MELNKVCPGHDHHVVNPSPSSLVVPITCIAAGSSSSLKPNEDDDLRRNMGAASSAPSDKLRCMGWADI